MGEWTDKDSTNKTMFAVKDMIKLKDKLYKAMHDDDREARLKLQLCPQCFYIHTARLAGQAFTTTNCGNCNKEMTFPTTACDRLCPECADERNLCKRCGAKVDYTWA